MLQRGKYITLSGGEACGKTTQIKYLAEWLEKKGKKVFTTREPGGSKIGSTIRKIILDPVNTGLDPLAELLLYEADRAHHINQHVMPTLERGAWVLSDRCFLETEAYQGYARGMDLERVRELNKMATRGLVPDLAFIIDGDPEILQNNLHKRVQEGESMDRLDLEKIEFHKKVREGFLDIAKRYLYAQIIQHKQGDPNAMQQEMRGYLVERFRL